jgi:hypothetical protein
MGQLVGRGDRTLTRDRRAIERLRRRSGMEWTMKTAEATGGFTATLVAGEMYLIDTSAPPASVVLTAPPAAANVGKLFGVKRITNDTFSIGIQRNVSPETLEGGVSLNLVLAYDYAVFVSDGSGWWRIAAP